MVIFELFKKNLSDIISRIQSYEIGQLERTHGVTAAEFHGGVDILSDSDPRLQGPDGIQ